MPTLPPPVYCSAEDESRGFGRAGCTSSPEPHPQPSQCFFYMKFSMLTCLLFQFPFLKLNLSGQFLRLASPKEPPPPGVFPLFNALLLFSVCARAHARARASLHMHASACGLQPEDNLQESVLSFHVGFKDQMCHLSQWFSPCGSQPINILHSRYL